MPNKKKKLDGHTKAAKEVKKIFEHCPEGLYNPSEGWHKQCSLPIYHKGEHNYETVRTWKVTKKSLALGPASVKDAYSKVKV